MMHHHSIRVVPHSVTVGSESRRSIATTFILSSLLLIATISSIAQALPTSHTKDASSSGSLHGASKPSTIDETLRWDARPNPLGISFTHPIDPETFVPPPPIFPSRFRAKCRFLVGPGVKDSGAGLSVFERAAHSMSLKPTLSLVHVDAVSMKVREDFYTLTSQSIHRRFFTSIKHFRERSEWIVYHKQPKSPRACFEIPFSGTVSALFATPGTPKVSEEFFAALPALGEQLEYQGLATIHLLEENDALESGSGQNVTVLHYKIRQEVERRGQRNGLSPERQMPLFASNMPPVHVYIHPLTHQPLVVSTPHLRIDILSFQVVSDQEQIEKMQAVFSAQRASKAKCVPFTSQTGGATKPPPTHRYKDEL